MLRSDRRDPRWRHGPLVRHLLDLLLLRLLALLLLRHELRRGLRGWWQRLQRQRPVLRLQGAPVPRLEPVPVE